MILRSILIALALSTAACVAQPKAPSIVELQERYPSEGIVKKLTDSDPESWRLEEAIPLAFNTFHPQGLVRIGDEFLLSSVEVKRRARYKVEGRRATASDEGEGKAWLFRFNRRGELLEKRLLAEDATHHPGGMDYDGRYVWIPITKYYPYSGALIVRYDTHSGKVEQLGEVDDSVGALVCDTDNRLLIGANWDAKEFLVWELDRKGQLKEPEARAEALRRDNRKEHLAIQDSKYIGEGVMIGFGLRSTPKGRVGGYELIDTRTLELLVRKDIRLKTPRGALLSSNPSYVEPTASGLRLYFAPEDNNSTLYIYTTDAE